MDKENEKRSVQANMLFNTVGSLIYYVCQWLMSVLVVKLSGTDTAGVLGLAMTVTASPAIVALFNMRSYQVSDVKKEYNDKVYVMSRHYTNILALVMCIISVLVFGYTGDKVIVIMVFMLFKLVEGFADVYYGIDQRAGRLDYAGISMTVRGIGSLVCFVLGIRFGGSLLAGIILMSVFSFSVVFLYDRTKVRGLSADLCDTTKKAELKTIIKLLKVCIPLAIVAVLNNLSINQPKLTLEALFGETTMGIYNSISAPTVVIQLAATTMFAPLVSLLTVEYEKKNMKAFMSIIKKFSIFAGALVIVCLGAVKLFEVTGVMKWIFTLLFNAEIAEHTEMFFAVVIISILIAINACMFSMCTLLRAIRAQYIVGIIGLLASYLFTELLVNRLEMYGVIYALAGTIIIQIILQLAIIGSKLKKN